MDENTPHTEDTNSDPLVNNTPAFLTVGIETVISYTEAYGWFVLIAGLIILYLYQKYKPSWDTWRKKQEEIKLDEEIKKNPEKTYKIQLSVEEARLKLQQQVNVDAQQKKIEQEKRAEAKRQQNIEEWEKHKQGKGYHSKSRSQETDSADATNGYIKPKKKDNQRPSDYNPLTGTGGGSCSYRPGRRNESGGG